MPIEAVLFDLGGVVCTYQPERRLRRMAQVYDVPAEAIRERIWQTALPAEFDEGRLTAREWHETVNERLGRVVDRSTFDDLIMSAFSVDQAVVDVIRAIRVPRIAALTNNSAQFASAIPTHLPDLEGLLAPILCSYEFGARKPDRAAYHGALDRLGVTPARVLCIDDQQANVDAARAVGIRANLFTDVQALRQTLVEYALLPFDR